MQRTVYAVISRTCIQCSKREQRPIRILGSGVASWRARKTFTWNGIRTLSTQSREGTIFKSPRPDCQFPNVSLADYMFSRFDKFGDKVAMIDYLSGRSYKYSELQSRVRSIGSFLSRQGLRKGDVIAYYGTNNPEFGLLMLACSATGITLTTANPAYSSAELREHVQHSCSKAMVTVQPLVPKVQEALRESGIKEVIVIGSADGCRPFSELLEDDGMGFPEGVTVNPQEDVLVLPYSSGTTGLPKGVMLNNYNLVANLIQTQQSIETTPTDTNLGVLPFYHIYGMVPILFGTLQDGASLVTLPNFEPESFLTCIQKHKITQLHIVPPIILFMAKHPVVDKFDLSSLRHVFSAAAPLGVALTNEFVDRRKIPLLQGYGLTETSPVITIDNAPATVGSIGTLVPNTEAKIVDPETEEVLGRNQPGELCVRGPQNMMGYLHDEAATQAMIKDGWLYTGDIAYVTDDDHFVIADRLKELIKYKGFQVPPAELENLLLQHPAVQDVAVIGLPDDRAGELPRAYVVKKQGASITADDITQYVEENVAEYKQLRGGVEFIEQIPKSTSGKLLRRTLKEQLTSSTS